MQIEDLPPKFQEQVRRKLGLSSKSNKYNAQKTVVDGHKFDSKFEAEHYSGLRLLEKAGVISDLELQPRFLLQDKFVYQGHQERKIEYVADFMYHQDGKTIVEDTKSPATRTAEYKLKRKLFLYKYGDKVEFREVFNATDKS